MKKTIKLFAAICAIFFAQQFSAQTCTAQAGPDKNICCPGGSVTIGGAVSQQTSTCPCDSTHNIYSWTPTTGLSNPNILNPSASPNTTTVYKLCVTYKKGHGCLITCCTACDSMTVTVNNSCCRLMNPGKAGGITKLDFDIKVFPNPANDFLNVEINETLKNGEAIIYDISGKVIWQKSSIDEKKKFNVDVSNLPKGIYFIKVTENNKQVFSEKILLQ